MQKLLFISFLLFAVAARAQSFSKAEIDGWQRRAAGITIIRDSWGIPHVYGKTDADAVFGLLYAQCEDDFKRVEMNYIEKLGRMAEVQGEEKLYSDLYIRLVLDSADAVADYHQSPPWLKKLLQAYADGINFYLYKHPETKPALLTRFEPWFPLLWTDGSIGAISTGDVSEQDLRAFYSNTEVSVASRFREKDYLPDGSNGFAIAPARTEAGNAILYINPHTTFYFRPEVQMSSEEGLSVYGAVTWGQFFVYQGFNEHCGFMHTSSNVDVADLYELKTVSRDGTVFYEHEKKLKPLTKKQFTLRYKSGSAILSKTITAYYSHQGPVMAKRNGKWIAVRSYNRSLNGLMQCWLRNKATGLADYQKLMELRGNTSNNTVYADDKGNIAYWHGNFVPKRDLQFNWNKPVDGSIAATDWKGPHAVNETVHLLNPASGWIQNCNSTPFTASGASSPVKTAYPSYMAPDGENFRGINAVRVLSRENKFTPDKLIAAGYDTYLSAFEVLVPALLKAYDGLPQSDSLYTLLSVPMATLRNWNYYASANSVATTLAIEWAQKLGRDIQRVYINAGDDDQPAKTKQFAATAQPSVLLQPLREVIKELSAKFGSWQVAWGELNRYQRLTGNITETFDDGQSSLPVGFGPATWGSLPSFVSRPMPGTAKRYGYSGNSFVCVVEFGKKVKAKSVLAGGVSGNPASPHFSDQALNYTQGKFKEVLFYKEDVVRGAVRRYRPGE